MIPVKRVMTRNIATVDKQATVRVSLSPSLSLRINSAKWCEAIESNRSIGVA